MDKLDLPLEDWNNSWAEKPEEWTDDATLDAICKDIEKRLGWKALLGGTRKNMKLLLPIIQKHLMEKK